MSTLIANPIITAIKLPPITFLGYARCEWGALYIGMQLDPILGKIIVYEFISNC